MPVLWSCAFAKTDERGLILINLDTAQPREVVLKFDGTVDGPATSWQISAHTIDANNELDNQKAPEVKAVEARLDAFKSGHARSLPPHSMVVLKWEVE